MMQCLISCLVFFFLLVLFHIISILQLLNYLIEGCVEMNCLKHLLYHKVWMIDFGFFLYDIRGTGWPRVIRIILTFTTFILLLHPRLLLLSPCHDQDNYFFISLLRSYVMIKRKIINLVITFTTQPP